MPNQVLEHAPRSPAQDPFADFWQEQLRLEAELEARLNRLRAMSRIPQDLKKKAEAQLREAYVARLQPEDFC